MNSRCPSCSHQFRLPERKRFITWRFTRRPAQCPDCGTTLLWERRAHLHLTIGLFLAILFNGILLGTVVAPFMGTLMSGASVHDPYWRSASVQTIQIISVSLTLGAFALMLFGFLRSHLVTDHASVIGKEANRSSQ